jgi:hypothetical protein
MIKGVGWGMEDEWMDGRWDGGWRGRDGDVRGVLGMELKLGAIYGAGEGAAGDDE